MKDDGDHPRAHEIPTSLEIAMSTLIFIVAIGVGIGGPVIYMLAQELSK